MSDNEDWKEELRKEISRLFISHLKNHRYRDERPRERKTVKRKNEPIYRPCVNQRSYTEMYLSKKKETAKLDLMKETRSCASLANQQSFPTRKTAATCRPKVTPKKLAVAHYNSQQFPVEFDPRILDIDEERSLQSMIIYKPPSKCEIARQTSFDILPHTDKQELEQQGITLKTESKSIRTITKSTDVCITPRNSFSPKSKRNTVPQSFVPCYFIPMQIIPNSLAETPVKEHALIRKRVVKTDRKLIEQREKPINIVRTQPEAWEIDVKEPSEITQRMSEKILKRLELSHVEHGWKPKYNEISESLTTPQRKSRVNKARIAQCSNLSFDGTSNGSITKREVEWYNRQCNGTRSVLRKRQQTNPRNNI